MRGARRSSICDLQRERLHLVPNGLYEVVTEHRGRTLAELRAAYGHAADDVLDEYVRFLLEHDLGFWADDPDAFPPLDTAWDRPERITNAIVDWDAASDHPWRVVLRELDELGCRALQLRCYAPVPLDALEAVLALTDGGRLRSVELLVHWDPAVTADDLADLCARHPRVSGVFVHSAPAPGTADDAPVPIHYRTDPVTSETHCGQVHPGFFAVTLGNLTEARAHNSCLNRKISVDARGCIRNCPSMPRAFGNVRDTSLHAALAQAEFRAPWGITKDQVETCRDCEFRYVCTDCRAYVREGGGPLAKPAKCTYDPYTAQWA